MLANILVVDDNPSNLKLACDVLAAAGYRVHRAMNANEALEILKNQTIQLILMDIELPGTDGLTLTRQLKADASTRQIPVIALTAFAMKGDEERVLQAGCDGYITKPINTRQLPRQVEQFLSADASDQQ
jgi:CheY-like chemotaxis protein